MKLWLCLMCTLVVVSAGSGYSKDRHVSATGKSGQWVDISAKVLQGLASEGKKIGYPGKTAGIAVDRITGDAALYAAKRLIRARRRLSDRELHGIIERYLALQTRNPERVQRPSTLKGPNAKRVFDSLLDLTAELRYGL